MIATHTIGADRKNDPAIPGPLFCQRRDVELDGVAKYTGREVIAAGLSGLASFVTWSLHYMVSPLIEVDDAALTATCRWYL